MSHDGISVTTTAELDSLSRTAGGVPGGGGIAVIVSRCPLSYDLIPAEWMALRASLLSAHLSLGFHDRMSHTSVSLGRG
jgi:hypothetical protein